MIHHVGLEVSDLRRSAAFYDAVLFALGIRRLHEAPRAIAYGVDDPVFWIVTRGRAPQPGYGHLAFRATGRRAVEAAHAAGIAGGGRSDGPPAARSRYAPDRYSAYLLDPDGLRIEVAAGGR